MRTVAFLVGFFVLLAIAVIAARIGVYLLSDPPTIEVETTLAADLGEPVAASHRRQALVSSSTTRTTS